jgi:transcriptional regulator GlxA family with amidase domain
VKATIEKIREGMSRDLNVKSHARETKLSTSHLRRTFKAETGLSLNQYIKLTRLQEAERLLTSTFLSCKQVMNRVGMRSESHFSREFRKAHGIAPSKLRLKEASEPKPLRRTMLI